MIEVELLRGKGFPQSEDDPNPCTTQARVSILSPDLSTVICAEQVSSIQENSNAPFFKDVLSFATEGSEVTKAVVLVKIVEFSRRSEPYVLFYGELPFLLSEFKSKKELFIPLTEGKPGGSRTGARQELQELSGKEGGPCLSIRLQTRKAKTAVTHIPDSDVEISEGSAVLRGSTRIVPEHCEYVWLRLLLDKRWTEGFRYALSTAWRGQAPIGGTASSAAAHQPNGRAAAGGITKRVPAPAAVMEAEVRTIGDVVTKRWNCTRVHQVLTRVRLSAERYICGEASLIFSSEEEVEHRKDKKARAQILEELSLSALVKTGHSELHDWLDRTWVIFAVGIDNDPAGSRVLSYDVRKQINDAVFEEDDAVILQASLLHFFLPSLPFEDCQSIAEQQVRATLRTASVSETKTTGAKWEAKVTAAQRDFTTAIISFIGPLMETLTETELSKALKIFKPAVQDCFQRIAKGGKLGIQSRLRRTDSVYSQKGEGIRIKHLDKLGHRKENVKFA